MLSVLNNPGMHFNIPLQPLLSWFIETHPRVTYSAEFTFLFNQGASTAVLDTL